MGTTTPQGGVFLIKIKDFNQKIVLQENLAVGLHLLAGGQYLLHHGLGLLTIGKFYNEFLGHEIDGSGLNALGLPGGLLHQIGAVGAVHFDFVGLFHGNDPLSIFFMIKHLFNRSVRSIIISKGIVNAPAEHCSEWAKRITKRAKKEEAYGISTASP